MQRSKRHNEAENCFVEGLVLYTDFSLNGSSLLLAETLNNLGVNHCEMKQYFEAEKCLTQALSMYTDLSEGADSVDIADTLCNLAVCYLHRGKKQAAIEKFTKAHDIYMKVNPTNPHVTIIHKYLSLTSECKDRGDDARKMGESDNKKKP